MKIYTKKQRSEIMKKAWVTRRANQKNNIVNKSNKKTIDFIINGTTINIESKMLSKVAITPNAIRIDY
jgi:hypothetical protein